MKLLTGLKAMGTAFIIAGASASFAQASETISVTKAAAEPPVAGAPENFAGSVKVDSRFQAAAPARVSGGRVTCAPGARTAWHTHPL